LTLEARSFIAVRGYGVGYEEGAKTPLQQGICHLAASPSENCGNIMFNSVEFGAFLRLLGA